MGLMPPPDMSDIAFFITPQHPCSYLDDQASRMVFVDPAQPMNEALLSALSRQGFRRSGDFVYRPECQRCRQCLSSRLPVADFVPNARQRRVLRANQDLRQVVRPVAAVTPDHYPLYARYIEQRHADGDMHPPSLEQFEKFLLDSCAQTVFMEHWLGDRLMAVATTDVLDDGLSAVYTFFEPDAPRRSLGTYCILKQIEWVQQQQLDHLYLGYWVPGSAKMRYKAQFYPFEMLLNGRWLRLDQPPSDALIEHLIVTLSRPENIHDYRQKR